LLAAQPGWPVLIVYRPMDRGPGTQSARGSSNTVAA
jgi:hypothetical protein